MKSIIAAILLAGALAAGAADNFSVGEVFDGATGLKTGAQLEDMLTESVLTRMAGHTNNPIRLSDGTVIIVTNVTAGCTNWVFTIATNSITSGHIQDGTIQSNDLASALIDWLAALPIPTDATVRFEGRTPDGAAVTVNSQTGWVSAANTINVELIDNKHTVSSGVFTAPYDGMFSFTTLFYGYFPSDPSGASGMDFSTNVTTILCGFFEDHGATSASPQAPYESGDRVWTGTGATFGGGVPGTGGGTYGSFPITYTKTLALTNYSRVYPIFYIYSDMVSNLTFSSKSAIEWPPPGAIQAYLEFSVNEVSKGLP